MEEAQERRTAELDAIEAIYGDDVCTRTANAIAVRVDGIVVSVRLPDGYPGRAAPVVVIDANLPRAVREDAECRLRTFCEADECVLAVLQEAAPCFAAARAANVPVAAPVKWFSPPMYCVVVIDHMNDSRYYAARLKRWAVGLRAVLFSRPVPTAAAPSRREGGVLVLQGDDGLIGGFLTSLRAEAVDRDRRGRPCKERCAKVLCRCAMNPTDVALVEPWREETYDGGRAAGDALALRCVGGDCSCVA
jgi:hypothetical protein